MNVKIPPETYQTALGITLGIIFFEKIFGILLPLLILFEPMSGDMNPGETSQAPRVIDFFVSSMVPRMIGW